MGLTIIEYPQRNVENNPLFVSKWSAINHSMIFKMIRQDYSVNLFYNSGTEVMVAVITLGTMIDSPLPGDEIYIESPSNSATFTLASFSFPNVFIMEPQAITASFGPSGFINLLSRKNYFIRTNVYGVSEGNQYELIGQSKNKPDSSGGASVDVSSFLKNIIGYQDNFKYDVLNEKDGTLGSPYNITYSENWKNYEGAFSGLSTTILRFGVNSAKQIQDLYGQNMGEYVPFFIDLVTPIPEAKFLSDFKSPTYFPGFPFSLSFIYSENLVGIETFRDQENFDINGNPTFVGSPVQLNNGEAQEVNRLLIEGNYSSNTLSTKVWLETDGVADCLVYQQPGYVQIGYVEEICTLPPIISPLN
jgi:hypothetical protein